MSPIHIKLDDAEKDQDILMTDPNNNLKLNHKYSSRKDKLVNNMTYSGVILKRENSMHNKG